MVQAVQNVPSSLCLLRGALAFRFVVREEFLNDRAHARFIETQEHFVRTWRTPKVVYFRDAWIIGTVRNAW